MRLVSLCPILTELVFALGRGDEPVGGTMTTDPARIVALRPDLVLMNDEENRREDWELRRWAARPRERNRLADGELLSWHASRTPAGIDYAERFMRAR